MTLRFVSGDCTCLLCGRKGPGFATNESASVTICVHCVAESAESNITYLIWVHGLGKGKKKA